MCVFEKSHQLKDQKVITSNVKIQVRTFDSKFYFFAWVIISQLCRTALIQSALENTDPSASNGGSNVRIRPLEVDLTTFEMTELSKKRYFFVNIFANDKPQLDDNLVISKVTRFAPSAPNSTFDHRPMRQNRYFPAQFESALRDTLESLWKHHHSDFFWWSRRGGSRPESKKINFSRLKVPETFF